MARRHSLQRAGALRELQSVPVESSRDAQASTPERCPDSATSTRSAANGDRLCGRHGHGAHTKVVRLKQELRAIDNRVAFASVWRRVEETERWPKADARLPLHGR